MAPTPTLETLGRHAGASRRERPPTMIEVDEPLRPATVDRRASRLGLRNLFGRKGHSRDQIDPVAPAAGSPGLASLAAGSRTSIAESSSRAESVRSDTKDASVHKVQPLPRAAEPSRQALYRPARAPSKHQAKQPIAAWDAPPLFKAYPQALRHATLPTAALSPDAILKLREKRVGEAGAEAAAVDGADDANTDKDVPRRKKKSDLSTEWTTKTYLLVTSGCLLQYASHGPFDRAPEKVLQLSKSSAVFVSDAIPGRHWVLQVSSSFDTDGAAAVDHRSLFSRLRTAERRQAANFLMVFEHAQDMEGWLSTLRREILVLGGKQTLTETGKPKEAEPVSVLREQPSHRTLVTRDPNRYSQTFSIASGGGWQGIDKTMDGDETRQQSLDEVSATNSFISQDGRQLENLRDNPNRLSAISDPRTNVTSSGSSPSCSPIRDSFPSPSEEKRQLGALPSPSSELRPRPNAAAIAHRRRSYQTERPFYDGRPGPPGALVSPPIPEAGSAPSTTATPNFSVPHSSSRRFSCIKPVPDQPLASLPPNRPTGRKPPPTLKVARPLSLVTDLPSSPCDSETWERPATGHGAGGYARAPSAQYPSIASQLPSPATGYAAGRSSFGSREDARRPRRLSSAGTLRTTSGSQSAQPRIWPSKSTPFMSSGTSISPGSCAATEKERKRRSDAQFAPLPESLPEPTPPPTMPLPPLPSGASSNKHIQAARMSQQLLSRRSLPQLAQGPPRAPPPSCALPPIPQKHSVRV